MRRPYTAKRPGLSTARLEADEEYAMQKLSELTIEVMEVGRRALQAMPPKGNGPVCLGQLAVRIWQASVHATIQIEKLNRA